MDSMHADAVTSCENLADAVSALQAAVCEEKLANHNRQCVEERSVTTITATADNTDATTTTTTLAALHHLEHQARLALQVCSRKIESLRLQMRTLLYLLVL